MTQPLDTESFRPVEYVAIADIPATHSDGSLPENPVIVLDAIATDVLDRIARSGNALTNEGRAAADFFLLALTSKRAEIMAAVESGTYLRITVRVGRPQGDDEIAAQAATINDLGEIPQDFAVRIERRPPSRKHLQTLAELSEFKLVPDADERSLEKFYVAPGKAASLAVYDVGQASMNAVVDKHEHPLVFFDLGWPLSFNAKSIPVTKADFDPLLVRPDQVKIVLSHLDWDHWGFALESGKATWDKAQGIWKTEPHYRPAAIGSPWLMCRPKFKRHKLGPSHIHLVQTLDASGNLHFWPQRATKKVLGQVTVFKCKPVPGISPGKRTPAFLRNNEGLGMLVSDASGRATTLLPGDADYPSVPRFAKQNLSGLVATHHGGKVTPDSVPDALGHGRLIVSAFDNCYSNIPSHEVLEEAKLKGWRVTCTNERKACFRAASKQFDCGNRLIRLSTTPHCGCNAVPALCACISDPTGYSSLMPGV